MTYFSSNFKLGILGGGQLGKMLLYETQKYDIYTAVLDTSSKAPAKPYCNKYVKGNLMDYDTVYHFGKTVDILTFEIEHININALKDLEQEGLAIYPSAKTLEVIQNKAKQKLFYIDHNIPTADFLRFAYTDEIISTVNNQALEFPFVWKSTQFGYDGRGVKIIRNEYDLKALPNVECITEKLISFEKELAVTVARNIKGDMVTYPVVEMEFHPEANQVEYIICPARIDKSLAKKVKQIALDVSKVFKHVGLLTIELFLTQDHTILVNEVAPRPHNSAHHTIETSYTSQFEQHIRAILDLPLGKTELKVNGVMVNLVGEEGYQGSVKYKHIEKIMAMEGVTPHIYGKRETKPYRKMGHVTIANKDLNKAYNIAKEVKKVIKVISQ